MAFSCIVHFRWFLYSRSGVGRGDLADAGSAQTGTSERAVCRVGATAQTGLPLEIGKLNYNPLFPECGAGRKCPSARTSKPIKSIWKSPVARGGNASLHIAHLDIIRPQIKWQPGLNLPQPLRQLQIDDLTIDKMKLAWNNGSLDGGSLHLTNWQPIRDGEVLPFADVKI